MHQPCPRSSHGEVFTTSLCGAGKQTAAPIVLLFLAVQTPEAPLIPETAARESVVSYRSRFDLSFPKHEVSSSCSFSPRHNRQPLERFISERPLDKEQGEQSSVPRVQVWLENSRGCKKISHHLSEALSVGIGWICS